jgi:cytochrome d ubiquinol oxidase subunit II
MSAIEPSGLELFWAGVIAVAILVYVVLDGFDLGVGILFGTNRDAALWEQMMAAISPFWDGNETWLVVIGASLFGAFPLVYGVPAGLLHPRAAAVVRADLPRGCFRIPPRRRAQTVGLGVVVGSTVAAFVQGAAVGAMIRGIPVVNFDHSGNAAPVAHR